MYKNIIYYSKWVTNTKGEETMEQEVQERDQISTTSHYITPEDLLISLNLSHLRKYTNKQTLYYNTIKEHINHNQTNPINQMNNS